MHMTVVCLTSLIEREAVIPT